MSDVPIITIADRDPGKVFAASEHPSGRAIRYGCGPVAGKTDSDPSFMLGLVLLLAANTLVVAAVTGAIVWLVA